MHEVSGDKQAVTRKTQPGIWPSAVSDYREVALAQHRAGGTGRGTEMMEGCTAGRAASEGDGQGEQEGEWEGEMGSGGRKAEPPRALGN